MGSETQFENDDVDATGRRPLTRREFGARAASAGSLFAFGSLLAACGSSSSPGSSTSVSSGGGTPRRGGNLRVAMLGGSPTDTLDANGEANQVDNFRVMALYNGLVQFAPDGSIANVLAEEITPSKDARTWTVRLRPGVTFHNGKSLTAEDVIFTFRRIMNPKAPKVGASSLLPVDPHGMRARDKHTIEIKMLKPYSSFIQQIADLYNFGIVPVGYDPRRPVGTGPFKYVSFTPGQQSVFHRNENYFRSGRPYLDQLTIIDSYGSDAAAQNALQGGEVDAYAQAPLTLAKQFAGNSSIKQLISHPAQWVPFTMRVDQAPFNDVRVRQAFRLLVDRKQVAAVAYDGLAVPGNDVFCPNDPDSDKGLVRNQDLEQAKSLLKQAGHEHLTVQLQTADIAAGAVSSAQVFAQQAQAAGVTVNIANLPTSTFFGPNYLKWTFAMDFWGNPPYLATIAQAEIPGAPFNETHVNNPRFNALYAEANATVDPARQRELIHEMQMIDFNEGGYIIPTFNRQLDLLSTRVNGLVPSATGLSMGNADWENVWLA
jgi:peptide/nickel transport system substrate-binding protein